MTIITQYTQVLSRPGETFCYRLIDLCDDCRAEQPECSKMGRVYNACCELCGATDIPPLPAPATPTTEIAFNHDTKDYDCFVNGQYIGSTKTQVEGDILINTTLGSHPLVAQNISMQIAKLALEYGKATNDIDRKAIKTEAKRLMAIRDGIEYDVFNQEHAAFVAEQQAA